MNRSVLWLLIASAVTVPAFFVTAWVMPQVTMLVVMSRLGPLAGVNRLFHTPPPTHESFAVVTPSPDLAYSICIFDLADGPVQVIADYPEGAYWSISAYAYNTDNFFVANDQTTDAPPARFVFGTNSDRDDVIVSPSRRGVILLRHHIADPDAIALIDERRKNSICEPLAE
ncbi:MAG: DUF1254 domain-containing protein [Paracoccaceae bacterium]